MTQRSESGDAAVPQISVVVAPTQRGESLPGALHALGSQIGAPAFEVIVPIDATVVGIDSLRERFPQTRFVNVEGTEALARSPDIGVRHLAIDRRRAAGLAAARAGVIALTEEHARPDPDWCARMAAAHDGLPHAVIGGAVENANDRAINWALFLADAGRYQNPLPTGNAEFVSDINVSYKRDPLFEISTVWGEVYNETRIHDALRTSGHTLWLSPDLVVRIDRGPVTVRHAIQEAFAWARLYAGRRVSEIGVGSRVALALTAPLLGPLLLLRQTRIAWARGKRRPFLRCLPLLLLIDLARSAGEWVGYVSGREAPSSTDS